MIPFDQYLELKDNYCLGYFGEDKDIILKLMKARKLIEEELKGARVFLALKDADLIRDGIPESKMADYKGKMAFFCTLEKKEDIKELLDRSKIPIPDDF